MLNRSSFTNLEIALTKANDLVSEINTKNLKWPGSPAEQSDYLRALEILKETNKILSEIISDVSSSSFISTNKTKTGEIKSAIDDTYSLLDKLYEDVFAIKIAYECGGSQSESIKKLNIHVAKFTKSYVQTREYLLIISQAIKN